MLDGQRRGARLHGVVPRLRRLIEERPRSLVVSTSVLLIFLIIVACDPAGGSWGGAVLAVGLLLVLGWESSSDTRGRAATEDAETED